MRAGYHERPMHSEVTLAALRRHPDLGWMKQPSRVHEGPALAKACGAKEIYFKRDDELLHLCGGSKIRKLSTLLAMPTFQDAKVWHSIGATGSGHLLICAMAAAELGKEFHAHCFPQPDGPGIAANFAQTKKWSHRLHWYSSRVHLGLRRPQLMTLPSFLGEAILPPGGTSPAGTVGFVLAGFELAAQIANGLLPVPERVYLPIGSGGTALGLAIGLQLAGVPSQVHAVATVEALLVSPPRLRWLHHGTLRYLRSLGVECSADFSKLPMRVDTRFVGRYYADPTLASLQACALAREDGVPLEAVYTGKAAAALCADSRAEPGGSYLLWCTNHRPQER